MSITYGPVELLLVGFEGEVHPESFKALADLAAGGVVTVLDLVLLTRGEDGELVVTEVADHADDYGLAPLETESIGLVGEEDIAELAGQLAPGTSAVLVAIEQTYARALASQVNDGGGIVLRYERIPAPIVNAAAELAE